MSATVTAMLNEVRSHLGYVEAPVNRTMFGAWYGLDGNSWCDMFQSYCADKVGAADIIGKFAFTPSHANFFRQRGQFNMTPAPGALVFFQWPGSNRICHIGIVESVRPDGRIVTLEGNSQPGESGNQSNGGGVYRRVRALTYVKGFGHPAYASQTANAAELKSTPQSGPGLAVDGEWGPATTTALQAALHVGTDGVLGPVTYTALQRRIGTAPDGQWGPNSRRALQRYLGVAQDGAIGPVTVRALQARLNAGTF